MRELSLREGDVVKIYSRIGGDQGWWKGEANGRVSGADMAWLSLWAGFGQAGISVQPAPAPCPHPLSHRLELPRLELDPGPSDAVSGLRPALWSSVATAGPCVSYALFMLLVCTQALCAGRDHRMRAGPRSPLASPMSWGDGKGYTMFPPTLPLHALPEDSLLPVHPVTLQHSMAPYPCTLSGPNGFDLSLSELTQQDTGAPRGADLETSSYPWGCSCLQAGTLGCGGSACLGSHCPPFRGQVAELVCLHLACWLPFGGLGSDPFSTPHPFRSVRPPSPGQLTWRAEPLALKVTLRAPALEVPGAVIQ